MTSWKVERCPAGRMQTKHGDETRPTNFSGEGYVIVGPDDKPGWHDGRELYFGFKDEAYEALENHKDQFTEEAE